MTLILGRRWNILDLLEIVELKLLNESFRAVDEVRPKPENWAAVPDP